MKYDYVIARRFSGANGVDGDEDSGQREREWDPATGDVVVVVANPEMPLLIVHGRRQLFIIADPVYGTTEIMIGCAT